MRLIGCNNDYNNANVLHAQHQIPNAYYPKMNTRPTETHA